MADVTPSLAIASGASGTLSALARPLSTATPSMIAQSNLVPIQLIRKIDPIYPVVARVRRLSGSVVIHFTVGKDGKVKNPQFKGGPPIFMNAAFDAVKQWQYKPAMLNGQTIEQQTDITLKFAPN
jgi:protein TonB